MGITHQVGRTSRWEDPVYAATSQILTTKLWPPVRLAHAIDRPRLRKRLVGPLPRLVLVVAAAGFGKTTLIAQWHASLGDGAAWLSLDRNDHEPVTFARHLIAAINRRQRVISTATEGFVEGRAGPLDPDELTVRIANDLAGGHGPHTVFLDDYHSAETPVINALVGQLIDRAGDGLRLVIASRSPPLLPIARYRADNLLLELGMRELRFNHEEADAFLRHGHGVRLPPRELQYLVQRTEGWGVGLHLACLLLKDHPAPQWLIPALSGDMRDIADYLTAEVLRRLPPQVQHFLLHTSVLDRLTADICNTLLDRDDGQLLLEQIEAQGLFLLPLDAFRGWYRYHHLFRDFLRAQLRRLHPGLTADLQQRASRWFEHAGLPEEAVNMALDAQAYDRAAALVEQCAIDMIKQGHIPQVARWIRRLPAQVLEQNPRLPLYQCWAVAHMGQVQQAERLLQYVEDRREAICGDSAQHLALLQAEISTVRTIVALMSDDTDRAHAMASIPLPQTAAYEFFAGCRANVVGLASLARGDFADALAAAQRAARLHAASGCAYGLCYSRCTTGLAHWEQGRLTVARRWFASASADAVRDSGERSFNAAMPRVLMALLHYEVNALDEAYALLEEDLPLVDECAYVDVRTAGFLAMAGVLGARGHFTPALAYLDQAVANNVQAAFERTCVPVDAESIRLRLQAGDVVGARRFARHIGMTDGVELPAAWTRPAGLRAISQCRLLIAEGDAVATLEPLRALATMVQRADRHVRLIQILSLLIVAQIRTHQAQAAFVTVRRVLALGASEGFVRSVLDQGAVVGETLAVFARMHGETATLSPMEIDYLGCLCAAVHGLEQMAPAPDTVPRGSAPVRVNGIPEKLTGRELRILRLLASGASNQAIGGTLFISVNTVRWHVANILSKLQVENRTQAVPTARALGLTP